jgi:predicted nucleotidyltransferase
LPLGILLKRHFSFAAFYDILSPNGELPVIDQTLIAKATKLLLEAAHPTRIILFGSYGRGDAGAESDIDLLVVEHDVKDRVAEMTRLNRVLSPLRLSVDLLVVSQATFDYWASTPGNVYFQANQEGKVLYAAA